MTFDKFTNRWGFLHMSLPWSELPSFLAVARNGSLSAAARTLKIDRTTVARHVEAMERKIEGYLFERMDGLFVLTPLGRQIFAAAEAAEQSLTVMERYRDGRTHKGGRVRVSMSEHLLLTLAHSLKEFSALYPDILLELSATDRRVDLRHFEADVVLRISRGASHEFISKKVGEPIFKLYHATKNDPAKMAYLARPSEIEVPKYLTKYIPNAAVGMAVDGLVSMKQLIVEGAGVGILPQYFGDSDPRIKSCSPALPQIGFGLYIGSLPEQRNLYRIRTFAEFIETRLRSLDGL